MASGDLQPSTYAESDKVRLGIEMKNLEHINTLISPLRPEDTKRVKTPPKRPRRAVYCKHNIFPSQCNICTKATKCIHLKQPSRCIACGGKEVCEHLRRRSSCKECNGSYYCKHGKIRYRCKECGGKSICFHGKIRYQCRICGNGFCKHMRRKGRCKECASTPDIVPNGINPGLNPH